MKKRLLSLFIILCMLLSASPTYSLADRIKDDTWTRIKSKSGASPSSYSAIIMQGNTESASDCVSFELALISSGNGYDSFARRGWRPLQNTPLQTRVTLSQFQSCNLYHVAYYSGHGGKLWGNESYPVLNAQASQSYGTSTPFNVATALGVAGDNWMNTCTIDVNDNLHTMVLASCHQLDISIVKYYARIIKASSVSVILGYHDVAPSDGDDVIATNFVVNADNGNNAINAWRMCNSDTNWAALYMDVRELQEYYLPGFPASNLIKVDYNNKVYRCASLFEGVELVETSSIENTDPILPEQLPATITLVDSKRGTLSGHNNREPVWGSTNVIDDNGFIVRTLTTLLGEDVSAKPCAKYRISREEVDEQIGIVPGTEVVVERTYKYFDTFNGVKIADSFVSATIDSEGINNITEQRKIIPISNTPTITSSANKVIGTNYLSESDALDILLYNHSCIEDSELMDVSLAYVPDDSGNHVLCYEFVFSDGFHYVNISTGEIVPF